ncbi:hypothetical protein C8R46DRAFT_906589 [Mycena filopes]|nr:hypothetical protein C8R46DRAFT_906589 [Mycena filopes]
MPYGLDPELWNQIREDSRRLLPGEQWWLEKQPFLLSKGYGLRPRYQPDWVPTWELPGNEEIWPPRFEDSLPSRGRGNVLDATRLADNRKVVLKLVKWPEEVTLTRHFGQELPDTRPSAQNRCVPLLDIIHLPAADRGIAILVLPLLRQFDEPPFKQLGEHMLPTGWSGILPLLLHGLNIVSRDLCRRNLMMDATNVVPKGWHFAAPFSQNGTTPRLLSIPRHSVAPVEYFIIDFGLSTSFPADLPVDDARDVGRYGQDKTVPELSDTVPYNPFKVDIYQLGNVIMNLIETYEGLEIFRELAELMTRRNPDDRPTASDSPTSNSWSSTTSMVTERALLRANSGLREREIWWVEHQPFLLSRGYALRQRYNPNWTPTWELPRNEELSCLLCEDSLPMNIPGNVLDAVRTADNVKVVLKLVSSSREVHLSWYLGEYLPTLEPDENNRSVPLLETIDFKTSNIKHDKYLGILVFPFLRQFDDPPFRRLSEVTEAIEQFLRGMEYLHRKNVAHRDLCHGNLMVDARQIIPLGWHFIAPYSHSGTKVGIRSEPRSSVKPLDYYIIDFGLSREFYDVLPENAQDVGKYGQDKTVPELSETVAYNPFKVDIYQLGNVIAKLLDAYEGLEIFSGLAKRMTSQAPGERPTASECLKIFSDLVLAIAEDGPVHHIASSDSESDDESSDGGGLLSASESGSSSQRRGSGVKDNDSQSA